MVPGSGWVAGKAKGLIVTSRHNLLDPQNAFEADWVDVWIGGATRRVGEHRRVVRPASGWNRADDDVDLALLSVGKLETIRALAFGDLGTRGQSIVIVGYAADGDDRQRLEEGVVQAQRDEFCDYTLPTAAGMSGSPVWTRDDNDRIVVVAVHRSRSGGVSVGVRLTTPLCKWIDQHR